MRCAPLIDRGEDAADRAGPREVGRGLASRSRVEALLPVERAAVEQPVDGALGVLGHAHHAEEVALDVEQAAAHALRQPARRQHCTGRECESHGPASRRHQRIARQARGGHHSGDTPQRIGQPDPVGDEQCRQHEHGARQHDVAACPGPGPELPEEVRPVRESRSQYDRQRVLDDPVEERRGDDRIEDPAQQPAQGDRHVEGGEEPGFRSPAGQCAMTGDGSGEEREQVERDPERMDEPGAQDQDQRQDEERQAPRREHHHRGVGTSERDDEAQQVQRQRDDPEERHRGEVGRQVGRHAHQPARRDEDQDQPAQCDPQADLWRRTGFDAVESRPVGLGRSPAQSPRDQAAAEKQYRHEEESAPPEPRLRGRLSAARSQADRPAGRAGCRHCSRHRGSTGRAPGDGRSASNQLLDQRRRGGDHEERERGRRREGPEESGGRQVFEADDVAIRA